MCPISTRGRAGGARAVGRLVSVADLRGLDGAVRLEVASVHQIDDVGVGLVRTRDPARPAGDPGVEEVSGAVAPPGRLRSEDLGADVAGHELRVGGQVLGAGQVDLGGGERGLDASEIDLAVPGKADDEDLACPVGLDRDDHDVLQGVLRAPRAVLARGGGVDVPDQGLDRRGPRSAHRERLSDARGIRLRRGRRGHRLRVGRVSALGEDERVLSDLAGEEELLAARAPHRPRDGRADDVGQAQPVEDPLIGLAHRVVGGVQPRLVDVEGVGVLHDEFAPADHPRPGAGLVPVLRLDLVEREGQVPVGGVEVLDQEREHLLVGRGQEVVGVLAVPQLEQRRPVVLPPAGRLVGLPGQERREVDLLRSGPVHLLADHPLDPGQDLQPQREPRVDPRGDPADVPPADQEFVARDLGVGRVLAQSSDEESGHFQHGTSIPGRRGAPGGSAGRGLRRITRRPSPIVPRSGIRRGCTWLSRPRCNR